LNGAININLTIYFNLFLLFYAQQLTDTLSSFLFIIVVDVDAAVDVVNSFKFYSGHEISDDGFDSIQFNSIDNE
jgi:hypothetical protein